MKEWEVMRKYNNTDSNPRGLVKELAADAGAPFEAILSDMDGTMVDTEPLWFHAEVLMMQNYGLSWTEQDQIHCHGVSSDKVAVYMAQRIQESGQQPPTAEELADQFLEIMLEQFGQSLPAPQPGILELLTNIKTHDIPRALVTSSPRPLMQEVVQALAGDMFDATVAAEDVERRKPDPLPYLLAAELLGVDVRECIAIEDSPTGMASAVAAGAFVVGVDHLGQLEPGPRRVIVDSLSGIDYQWLAQIVGDQAVSA